MTGPGALVGPRVAGAVERCAGGFPGRSVLVEVGAERWGFRTSTSRPAASLLKIPVVLAVEAAAAAGTLDPTMTLTPRDLPPSRYPSLFDLFLPDHPFTLEEVAAMVMATSDNRAANLLIELVGRERVNTLLGSLGCRDTVLEVWFHDEDLGPRGRRNRTTAEDALRLLEAVEAVGGATAHALSRSVHNTRLPAALPDDTVIRHKTGTLAGVVNDIGIVEAPAATARLAFLFDGEASPTTAAEAISTCTAEVWQAVGEGADRTGRPLRQTVEVAGSIP